MSKPDSEQQPAESSGPSAPAAQDFRIDGAHTIQGHGARQTVAAEALAPAVAAEKAEGHTVPPAEGAPGNLEPADALVAAQRLYTQAAQLAAQLRSRQENLDHREAQLNARLARLEQGSRAARLWVTERETEITRRLEDLGAREKSVATRLERLAVAESALERKAGELESQTKRCEEIERRVTDQMAALAETRRRQEAESLRAEAAARADRQRIVAEREASLQVVRQALAGVERRRVAIEAEGEKLRREASTPSPDLLAREEELRRDQESLQGRAARMEQAEARLAEAEKKINRLWEDLRSRQEAIEEQARADRRQLAIEQRQGQTELKRQREALQRRSQEVDRSHSAMEQLRAELGQIHRETLELRLATEELWLKVSAAANPAEMTRSLGEIRARLADAYRDASDEIRRRKEDLESVRNQLAEEHEELLRKKHQFDGWAQRRQAEIEQMAQRLVDREQQLHQQERELANRAQTWELERLEYQQELRRREAETA